MLSQDALNAQETIAITGQARVVYKVAKELLLYGRFHYNGKWILPQSKTLGAGVYLITQVNETNGIIS